MEAFARAGINTNWLLTGEGPMLLADLDEATAWRARAERAQAERDELAARLKRALEEAWARPAQPAGQPEITLNPAAMQHIITGVLTGQAGRGYSPEQLARHAVNLYLQAVAQDFLTADGQIGEGGEKSA